MKNDNNITRRTLLASAPVAGLAPVLPSIVNAAQPDPVLPLYEAWKAAVIEFDQYLSQHSDLIDETVENTLYDKRCAAMKELMVTNATTLEGILCLALASWTEDGPETLISAGQDQYGWGKHRLLQRIVLSLETITGQQTEPALREGCWAVADY